MHCDRGESLLPYTSEEIKQQLEDAIKKMRSIAENTPSQDNEAEKAPSQDAEAEKLPLQGDEAANVPSQDVEAANAPSQDNEAEKAPLQDAEQDSMPSPGEDVEPEKPPIPDESAPEQTKYDYLFDKPDKQSADQKTESKEPNKRAIEPNAPARRNTTPSKSSAQQTAPPSKSPAQQTAPPGKSPAQQTALSNKPAALQKKAPARQRPAAVPNVTRTDTAAKDKKIRTYDISPDGTILERTDSDSGAFPKLDTGPEEFNVKFDFESAYRDMPEDNPLRLRREKRTGCVGGILYSVFVICVSLVLASLAWLAASDVLGFGASDEQINVTVQKGFTIDYIVDTLYNAGLIKYKFLFKLYAEYSKAEDKISPGQYVLNRNFDYRAIVYGMTTRGGVLVETTVTIPEGFTLAEIFTRLEDSGVCPATDLWETATNHDFKYSFLDNSTIGDRLRLEGFLFPDTYNFYYDSSPVQVINKLLGEFNNKFTETFIERTEDLGYSIRDIVTIASMIEREAGSDEERPRIAAVIYNRLNNSADFTYLQIDATIWYVLAGTGRAFSTDVESPYNTYLHEGLPPGPIANPGLESIHAALYPDSTNEYYYARNKQGTHEFFRTLEQHEAFVASEDFGGQ